MYSHLKRNLLIVSTLITILLIVSTSARANQTWQVFWNGERMQFSAAPFMDKKQRRLYIPLRDVQQQIGARLEWDIAKKIVYVSEQKFQPLATRSVDPWSRLIRTENMPVFAARFPYVLKKYSNEMYDLQFPYSKKGEYKTPRQLFASEPLMTKGNLNSVVSTVKKHYQMLLNANYRDTDNPLSWAAELAGYRSDGNKAEQALASNKKYIDWVIKNKITIEGQIYPEPSMIYFSGYDFFIRCQYSFRIKEYAENKGLLYDLAYDWNKLEKDKWYRGVADILIDMKLEENWGKHAKVSTAASLFYNSTISKR